ncbi:primase alpha helix C-terminal domain-containing protein [Staphylococcus chromogenes]|uniref:primase alpha helix C-terminal domain-containing protein n=1 Tax=Staphylococcus chromogenes TaxID=46126 RepID=UPI001E2A2C37|nr:primase alpha helix C-terminal domain-containing protein [Staphylococcus chromogenes]MCD8905029.1 primase alpha helix C-terminal domain-containing protein [Staphylococcus chromogenes]
MKIQLYKSVSATSFIEEYNLTWSEFLKWLDVKHIDANNKYARGLMIAGDIQTATHDQVEKHRKDANIVNRSMIVIDYDDLKNSIDFIQRVYDCIGKLTYCIYSTYNHTHDSPRYRLIIPLSSPLDKKYYSEAVKSIANKIDVKYDRTSKIVSQAMALPVVKSAQHEFIFKVNKGVILDTKLLINELDALNVFKERNSIHGKQFPKHDTSHWRSICMGVDAGERNTAMTQIIGHLLRRYVDKNLAYGLASAWAKTCNPPIKQSEVDKTFLSILRKHYNN